MNNPLISVIVPVYNAEPYLERCVNSIRNQTYSNLEIILVDDGSPDRCGEMCDEYAKQDPRILVIHKKNGGQSSARNAALDVMKGDYVGFVDSDDWIESDLYARLMALIQEHHAQISVCGVQCDWSNGKTILCNNEYPKRKDIEHWSKIDALRELTLNTKITNAPWNKLFERRIFDGLRMREGWVYEDFEIMPKCIERAEHIIYDPKPLYHYIMTDESTIRGAFKERRFIEADVSKEIVDHYKKNYPELTGYVLARHVEICLILIYDSAVSEEFSGKRTALIDEIKKMRPSAFFRCLNKITKLKYCAFKVHVRFYMLLMKLYHKIKG